MKAIFALFAVCALCAVTMADDVPAVLQACSFRVTAELKVVTVDGEELASSINEIIHDNGDYWVWKSSLTGNDFMKTIVPDHEWAITWRQDMGRSFRHDIMAQKCYNSSDTPTPFKWIESKTYGILWFDEPVWYDDKEATLYTAVAAGMYGKIEYETETSFYVTNDDGNLVHVNGTLTAESKGLEVYYTTTRLSFEHNKPIDPATFAVSAPCPLIDAPEGPDDTFKEQCYHESGASFATMSWLALLVAVVAALLNF